MMGSKQKDLGHMAMHQEALNHQGQLFIKCIRSILETVSGKVGAFNGDWSKEYQVERTCI